MTIRKLVSGDYEQVRSLYQELDDFHVQARPDCFVSREDAYHRKDYEHNLAYPDGLELGAFDGDCLVGFVRATLWHESFIVKDLKTVCLDNIYSKTRIPPPGHRREALCPSGRLGQRAGSCPAGASHLGLQPGSHCLVPRYGDDTPAVCV